VRSARSNRAGPPVDATCRNEGHPSLTFIPARHLAPEPRCGPSAEAEGLSRAGQHDRPLGPSGLQGRQGGVAAQSQTAVEVTRMKLEATGRAFGAPESDDSASALPRDVYFEHHATVLLPEGFDEQALHARCNAHGGYVSKNLRKHTPQRFITIRSYQVASPPTRASRRCSTSCARWASPSRTARAGSRCSTRRRTSTRGGWREPHAERGPAPRARQLRVTAPAALAARPALRRRDVGWQPRQPQQVEVVPQEGAVGDVRARRGARRSARRVATSSPDFAHRSPPPRAGRGSDSQ
jgi:hypothetical protein